MNESNNCLLYDALHSHPVCADDKVRKTLSESQIIYDVLIYHCPSLDYTFLKGYSNHGLSVSQKSSDPIGLLERFTATPLPSPA
jgi:hypothetical protein